MALRAAAKSGANLASAVVSLPGQNHLPPSWLEVLTSKKAFSNETRTSCLGALNTAVGWDAGSGQARALRPYLPSVVMPYDAYAPLFMAPMPEHKKDTGDSNPDTPDPTRNTPGTEAKSRS